MNERTFLAVTDSLSETARKTPDKTAVICEDASYSYVELDQKSDLLAAVLCSTGIKIERESYIAFILNRSLFVPVTMLGILKTGAAFIPFTPDTPAERLRYCMKDAGCRIVITTEKLKSEKPELQDSSYLLLTVEELLSRAERESLKRPCVQIQEKDAAMCLFT
ncbi:MAG: AMP-binding protein, partial [Treponema sp.]|nr:AMP-binding protein [Treponema sp.]